MLTLAERDCWTAALRSGQYVPIYGCYFRPEGPDGRKRACAIGVGVYSLWLERSEEFPYIPYGRLGLFREMIGRNWAEAIEQKYECWGFSFGAIADWIDENLPVESEPQFQAAA